MSDTSDGVYRYDWSFSGGGIMLGDGVGTTAALDPGLVKAYDNQIVSTVAYYDPATPNAQAAATALKAQFPAIKRVVAKFAELPAGPLVVVLTSDYS